MLLGRWHGVIMLLPDFPITLCPDVFVPFIPQQFVDNYNILFIFEQHVMLAVQFIVTFSAVDLMTDKLVH